MVLLFIFSFAKKQTVIRLKITFAMFDKQHLLNTLHKKASLNILFIYYFLKYNFIINQYHSVHNS